MNLWTTNTFESEKNWTVYPNPANNFINISMNQNTQTHSYSLYNMVGQKVAAFDTNTFETSYLPNGIYFLAVDGGKFEAQKVVIKH